MINLKRLSMDRLLKLEEEYFDSLGENHQDYLSVVKEINLRDSVQIRIEQINKEKQLKNKKELEDLKAKIKDNLDKLGDTKLDLIYSKYGEEYIQDYEVCYNSFIVKSNVAQEINEEVNSIWNLSSKEETLNKLKKLIYYRVYNKYMRNASINELEEFNLRLFEGVL